MSKIKACLVRLMSTEDTYRQEDFKVRKRYLRERFPLSSYEIAAFCRRNHIRKLSLFGSILDDDFSPDSDIDVLVEFDPDHIPGFDFVRIERELSDLLNQKIDLNTPQSISRYFRDDVLKKAETVYDAGA